MSTQDIAGYVPAVRPVFSERRDHSRHQKALALLTLSHTQVEHRLYTTMLREVELTGSDCQSLSIQRLMSMSPLYSYSTIRRGIIGLIAKLSVELVAGDEDAAPSQQQRCRVYRIFTPDVIFARRRAAGLPPYPPELHSAELNPMLHLVAERLVGYQNLTRREAQIALCCVEGLTNPEIGERLFVSEQTVKSHLRNIFVKMGVKRRTEMASHLLTRIDSRD
jgi:DNA-binding CsgD family transcriptional regulator